MAKKPMRAKPKDNGRRTKKKVSVLTSDRVGYIDYKDVNLLKRFVSDRAKVRARRVTGNDTQQQSEVARAIKNAREMALLPYTTRVTTQRSGRGDRGDRGDRGPRPDRRDDAPDSAGFEGVEIDSGEAVDVVAGIDDVEFVPAADVPAAVVQAADEPDAAPEAAGEGGDV